MTIRHELRFAVLTLAILAGLCLSQTNHAREQASCETCGAAVETL